MLDKHGEPDAVGKMKQFATHFTHGVRNGSRLRTEIYRASDVASILDKVDAFFAVELADAALAGNALKSLETRTVDYRRCLQRQSG